MTAMREVTLPFKVVVPHTPEAKFHQWVYLPGWQGEPPVVRRDARGREHRNAWRSWLWCICNNEECAGRAIVGVYALPDAAADLIAGVTR